MSKVFKILCVALISVLLVCLICGCSEVESTADPSKPSMFIKVETAHTWVVVYHRETKVMYTVSNYGDGSGVFTLLVNADGTPLLYQEEG